MRPLLVCLSLVVLVTGASAQKQQFEVASLKAVEMQAPFPAATLMVTGGRLNARSYPLSNLLAFAFDSPAPLVMPDWVRNSGVRVEIQAVMPAGATRPQARMMLQELLTQRMGLKHHVEQRSMPAYELVVAPGSPTIRQVEEADELNNDFKFAPGVEGRDMGLNGDTRTIISQRAVGEAVGIRTITARSNYLVVAAGEPLGSKFQLDAIRIAMNDFSSLLHPYVDRIVIDRTGLTGVYQFKIELPPVAQAARMLQRLANAGITTTVQGNPSIPVLPGTRGPCSRRSRSWVCGWLSAKHRSTLS